jgi:hypothetical protein
MSEANMPRLTRYLSYYPDKENLGEKLLFEQLLQEAIAVSRTSGDTLALQHCIRLVTMFRTDIKITNAA